MDPISVVSAREGADVACRQPASELLVAHCLRALLVWRTRAAGAGALLIGTLALGIGIIGLHAAGFLHRSSTLELGNLIGVVTRSGVMLGSPGASPSEELQKDPSSTPPPMAAVGIGRGTGELVGGTDGCCRGARPPGPGRR
jgi:hypothetical protein